MWASSFPGFQKVTGAWAVAQLGPPQNVVVHFGVGSSPVFLAQMQPQLTLVPEMQATGVALWGGEEESRVRSPYLRKDLLGAERGRTVSSQAKRSASVLMSSQILRQRPRRGLPPLQQRIFHPLVPLQEPVPRQGAYRLPLPTPPPSSPLTHTPTLGPTPRTHGLAQDSAQLEEF